MVGDTEPRTCSALTQAMLNIRAAAGGLSTAVGMDLRQAADGMAPMHGPFRFPSMVKLTDTLCRRPWLAS